MVNIAIVEDQEQLIPIMERFISQNKAIRCVLKASSLAYFFDHLSESPRIDIILLDIFLEEQNSLSHIGAIKAQLPGVKVIIMTGHQETEYLLQALQEGADSYYLKGSPPEQLIDSILMTYEGGSFLDPKAARGIIEFFQKTKQATLVHTFQTARVREKWGLSRRELEVAKGLYKEQTYKEIAQEYNMAIDTVRYYLKSLYKKMDVHNRIQLIQLLNSLFSSDI